MKPNKGFTLIELLVVISIIGVVSATVLLGLNIARVKARDARRISDLEQVRTALELYAADNNGNYPTAAYWYSSTDSSWNTNTNPLYAALVPKYISRLPIDPINNTQFPWVNGNYSYAYGFNKAALPSAEKYDLVGQLENTSSPYRCAVKDWIFQAVGGSWCAVHGYSPYLYSGY
jgi:prepilin-type N-terminal cleavage/methylation domain-containing protein